MSLFEEIKDKHILLVDDDESIRDSLCMFFLGEGIRIDALETAEEGVQALAEGRYDIVISDYMLPGMDGLSFLGHTLLACPSAHTVLITAYGSKEIISAAKRLGVDEYLEKPFSTKVIEEALSRLMGKGNHT